MMSFSAVSCQSLQTHLWHDLTDFDILEWQHVRAHRVVTASEFDNYLLRRYAFEAHIDALLNLRNPSFNDSCSREEL